MEKESIRESGWMKLNRIERRKHHHLISFISSAEENKMERKKKDEDDAIMFFSWMLVHLSNKYRFQRNGMKNVLHSIMESKSGVAKAMTKAEMRVKMLPIYVHSSE